MYRKWLCPAMTRFCVLAAAFATAATPAAAAKFQFCWIGGAGYTMEGIIEIPDHLLGTGVITQNEVTDFAIFGFHDGVPIGAWSLDQLTPETTWVLRFDTDALEFPMGGDQHLGTYQAWNANGSVNDCGENGFGFNGGDYAQDVCIDNTYVAVSSIDRFTPLPVIPFDVHMHCEATLPLS